MELIKQFGFDPVLFFAQIVNFAIVLWVLKRFLYKPLLDVLKKREQTILEGIKNAQEAEKRLEEATRREKQILLKAQDEAKKMLEEAKTQSLLTIQKAESEAKQLTQSMIEETRIQIAQQVQDVEKKLRSQISFIAVEFLRKSISQLFEDKDQEKILDRAMKQMQKDSN